MSTGRKVEDIIVPPYQGRAAVVRRGQHLFVVDVDGKQVGDFVCFNLEDRTEFVSPPHMRASLSSIRLREGSGLYSCRRRPLMRVVRDTVGVHDFFFPACDFWRYKVDFGLEDHPNCHDNLMKALRPHFETPPALPDPINFFMNNAMDASGDYILAEPCSKPGDYVELEALTDVLVALATCSQDLVPVNGMTVTRLRMQIFDPEGA